jgi:hypothetical protein
MTVDALKSLDDRRQNGKRFGGRPEAIRRLLEIGLKKKK